MLFLNFRRTLHYISAITRSIGLPGKYVDSVQNPRRIPVSQETRDRSGTRGIILECGKMHFLEATSYNIKIAIHTQCIWIAHGDSLHLFRDGFVKPIRLHPRCSHILFLSSLLIPRVFTVVISRVFIAVIHWVSRRKYYQVGVQEICQIKSKDQFLFLLIKGIVVVFSILFH